jgi:hypothetical protein
MVLHNMRVLMAIILVPINQMLVSFDKVFFVVCAQFLFVLTIEMVLDQCVDWQWHFCFTRGRYLQYAALGVVGCIVRCCFFVKQKCHIFCKIFIHATLLAFV